MSDRKQQVSTESPTVRTCPKQDALAFEDDAYALNYQRHTPYYEAAARRRPRDSKRSKPTT